MTVKGINILNIYYMLAYAFKALREGVYSNMSGEDFEHAEDLFGEILSLGLSHLLKRGLHRMYGDDSASAEQAAGHILRSRRILGQQRL